MSNPAVVIPLVTLQLAAAATVCATRWLPKQPRRDHDFLSSQPRRPAVRRHACCLAIRYAPDPALRRARQPSRQRSPPFAPQLHALPRIDSYDASSLHCAVSRPCEHGRTSEHESRRPRGSAALRRAPLGSR